MAQKQNQDKLTIGFKSIQLLKDQTLGIGSYGSVCKALCDDLLCAAKITHPTLLDPSVHQQIQRQREHRLPIHRFRQECEFMNAIRHPNIVQFLGTHQDPQTGLPILLMELMDDNLTHFLESSQDALPYHIQVNFCHNIILAISYLHTNGITHRVLSSNNVLLHGNVIAKVTDFGMAKFGDINPRASWVSYRLCPGTDAYMPPEVIKEKPTYTEKIDCFAIGTLIIQILTRFFPEPGERLKEVQTTDPRFPIIEVRVSEIERRQNHISLVDPNHPLLPIALECLKDSDVKRPSAQELCHRVAALKETLQFTESVRRAQERFEPAGNTTEREEELRQPVQDKDDIIQQKDAEIYQIRQEYAHQIQGLQQIIGSQKNQLQQKDDVIQEKNDIIREKNDIIQDKEDIIEVKEQTIRDQKRQLLSVRLQLESSQQATTQFLTKIQELEQELKKKSATEILTKSQPSLRDLPETHHSDTSTRTATATRDSLTLRWREGKKAPFSMSRGSNAVVAGDMVYIRAQGQSIFAYNSRLETWDQLPNSPHSSSSLVVIRNSLIAIGGWDNHGNKTNKLHSFKKIGWYKRWRKSFPPMPTKRSSSTAVTTGQALIVAGGVDKDWITLRTVEIMNIGTKQWSTSANLPEPFYDASITICRECIYIGGGSDTDSIAINSVFTCTLADLFLSCQAKSLGEHLAQSLSLTSSPRSTVWSKVADLPFISTTCITLHDQLLAIGGRKPGDTPTSNIYQYHSSSHTCMGGNQSDEY